MTSFSRRYLLVVVLSVAALAASACQPAGFYDTSSTDIPSAPGDIARSFTFPLGLFQDANGNLASSQEAHVVIYRSTSAIGDPNLVSGTVIVPIGPWTGNGSRPIVAMAPSTQGLDDSCAPSRRLQTGNYGEINQVNALVANGFAVALTDYEGLGTSGDHTYSVANSQAHAVLDMARAARNLGLNGLSDESPVALWGYSQGGASVARAAEIQASYAPDLEVKAVAAGGVVTDPYRQMEWVTDGLGRGFAGAAIMSVLGFDAAYPELDAQDAFTAFGSALAAQINQLCALEALLVVGGSDPGALFNRSVLEQPEWRNRLDEQILGTVAPQIPTYVYHGSTDFVVPIDQGYRLRGSWCAGGASVWFQEYDAEHFLTDIVASPTIVNWLSATVAGTATPRSNC